MSNDRVEVTAHGTAGFVGKGAVNVFRMMTLARGLRMEIGGMRMTRGRTCYAIIKEEFGLRGRKARVLEQFLPLVEQAKAAVPVVRRGGLRGGAERPPASTLRQPVAGSSGRIYSSRSCELRTCRNARRRRQAFGSHDCGAHVRGFRLGMSQSALRSRGGLLL